MVSKLKTYKKKLGNSKPKPPAKDHPWKTGYISIKLKITTSGTKDLWLPKKLRMPSKKKEEGFVLGNTHRGKQ